MMNLLAAHSAGIHFILQAAGALDTINCVSYEKFVLDDDLIGVVKHINGGVTVDDTTLALDVIKETGPRGYFLTKAHTLQNCRRSLFKPQIRPQRSDVQFRETEAAPPSSSLATADSTISNTGPTCRSPSRSAARC